MVNLQRFNGEVRLGTTCYLKIIVQQFQLKLSMSNSNLMEICSFSDCRFDMK